MSRTVRSIIVDDESLARELLRSMLADHPDVEVVRECQDGQEALRAIEEEDPDLVFLDVQMPGRTGLEVLQELDRARMPDVVFVTAYDQYALRAFEVNAVDYLLKPFDEDRLAEALGRARQRLHRAAEADETGRVLALLEQLSARHDYLERIAVKQGDRILLQPVAEVEWFEADGKYIHLHAGKQEFLIRETMTQMEQLLDPRKFLRISRSAIVNVGFIREITPWFHGDYAVVMRSGAEVTTTRSFRDSLKRLLDRT